jgi:capsular polysaccharide transport system permease protein
MSDHKLGLPAEKARPIKTPDRRRGKTGLTLRRPGAVALQRLDGLVTQARSRWRRIAVGVVVFLPTLLAAFYFTFVAADRYVSEAAFVVRSAAKPGMSSGLGSFLQLAGITRSQDDTFAVHEFMTSRDAVTQLEAMLPLRKMFGRQEADFVSAYPSFLYGSSGEDLHAYFGRVISVSYSSTTGISKLQVDAFSPQDAQQIASKLLELSEALVNRMNQSIHEDAVGFAEQDVADAQDRLIHSQALVTAFRNRELTLDPDVGARTLAELTGKMSAELAVLRARIAELEAAAPQSPLLPGLRSRAAAIEAQLEREGQQISASGDDSGIAQKMSEYESLMIAHEFANEDLGRALASLELARGEARKQQLFLERVVQPSLPDASNAPHRLKTIMAIFAANLILFLVGWFVWAGVREHAASLN